MFGHSRYLRTELLTFKIISHLNDQMVLIFVKYENLILGNKNLFKEFAKTLVKYASNYTNKLHE